MRNIFNPAFLRVGRHGLEQIPRLRSRQPFLLGFSQSTPSRSLAQVRSDLELRAEVWFTPSGPCEQLDDVASKQQNAPPDERTLKLGKSEASKRVVVPVSSANKT